jgi:hypothetical protein
MNPFLIGGLVAIIYVVTRKTGSSGVRASRNFTFAELSRTSTGLPNDPPPEAKAWLELRYADIFQRCKEEMFLRSPGKKDLQKYIYREKTQN